MVMGIPIVYCGFNPRSHMGSDSIAGAQLYSHRGFNPRSHMGSDSAKFWLTILLAVSIHAPTWGATALVNCKEKKDFVFQSTLPHGERLYGISFRFFN